MSHFLLEYRYVDMDARNRVRAEHLDYLHRLQAKGTLVMAGPLADTSGAVARARRRRRGGRPGRHRRRPLHA